MDRNTAAVLAHVFPGVEAATLATLEESAGRYAYPPGAILCRQGEPGETFFIIVDGRVAFSQLLEDGQEKIMGSYGPGQYFGELALLDRTPRRATATAETPVTVLEITTGLFQRLLQDSPAVAQVIGQNVLATLRQTDQQATAFLRAKNEELAAVNKELEIGRLIQQSFLPQQLPHFAGWEIATHFRSAREVAGDFYDAFTLSHGKRLALVLGDVCGKGVGAALFMALFRSLIRAYSEQHYSTSLLDVITADVPAGQRGRRGALPGAGISTLREAVVLTNNYIAHHHGDTNMFATLFFGVLDPATGALAYINGGHEPPLVIGPSGVRSQLEPTGPAVGMLPDMTFTVAQAQLEPGDILLAFTDGVTEARDGGGRYFGDTRLNDILAAPPPALTALLARIEQELQQHTARQPQADDITLLAVRRET
jgi:phosphoserine phosphatase RsbU/P